MLNFLSKLKKFALKSLIPGCLALVIAELLGGFFFNLDPVAIFTLFVVAFIAYFAILLIIALICFLLWYISPSAIILVVSIAAILFGTLFFITKTSPTLDVGKILADTDIQDDLLGFLKRPGEDYTEKINGIQANINASTPDKKEIDTILKTERGELNGSYTVTKNEDGSTTIEYTYEKFVGETEEKRTFSDTVTVSANESISNAKITDAAFITAMSMNINLNAEKLKDITVISGATTSVRVKASDTKDILGIELEKDAHLVISVSRENVTSIDVSYETEDGNVSISSVYIYVEKAPEITEDNTQVTE